MKYAYCYFRVYSSLGEFWFTFQIYGDNLNTVSHKLSANHYPTCTYISEIPVKYNLYFPIYIQDVPEKGNL